MTGQTSKKQTSLQKMAQGVKIAFFMSAATNLYDIFNFASQPSGVRAGLSIALGVIGTLLLWQISRELCLEKKQALYYWLAVALIGYTRWAFIDATFQLNIPSFLVILLIVTVTFRMTIEVKNKSLT